MKIKQTILAIALFIGISGIIIAPTTSAVMCNGVETSIISCDSTGGTAAKPEDTGIWDLLLLAINILTGGIVIAAIGGVVYGSIIYTTAGGSPDQVKKARVIIGNVIIGLVTYALMYSFMNFIIPGGLFA